MSLHSPRHGQPPHGSSLYGRGHYPPAAHNGAPRAENAEDGGGNVCRRAGCTTIITDMSMNGFCSNDCVLSQSREIYQSWSAAGSASGPTSGPTAGPAAGPTAAAAVR